MKRIWWEAPSTCSSTRATSPVTKRYITQAAQAMPFRPNSCAHSYAQRHAATANRIVREYSDSRMQGSVIDRRTIAENTRFFMGIILLRREAACCGCFSLLSVFVLLGVPHQKKYQCGGSCGNRQNLTDHGSSSLSGLERGAI